MTLRKALFLDRDGVVNADHGYVHRKENFDFVDGVFDLVSAARGKGYAVVIITNQSGIGRGYYTEAALVELMGWLKTKLAYDAYYFCPYHPEHGIGEFKRESEDRKPHPGMLLRAAKDHGLDLARSLMIGDQETDMQAAKKAGVGTKILFPRKPGQATEADVVIHHLREALPYL